ncbi:hypothetical protein BH772_gp035 [Gordonia phage Bachita]|uniref:Uncharacterized protein n=1 Tax=Gordonia phage Bachita TaxID=1838061 RepID=A0A160DFQ4_9CAUD|nr:hypothetical protein BH772_gp035 [Gordonia phage Bachita]ANA86850.1 hypothetical protein PBI_BACHITA_176 [Gordonia phage Bachita]
MSEFKLNIRTTNAAFTDETGGGNDEWFREAEIARILHDVADYIAEYGVGNQTLSIRDQNGNRVGGYKLEES